MTSARFSIHSFQLPEVVSIQTRIEYHVDAIIKNLPEPEQLAPEQRRGIIARYTAVLEGNFIYWMTGAYLAVRSDLSREILRKNLTEEVRDCHPGMLRRFAVAAGGYPRDSDALAITSDLSRVRLFIGRLSPTGIVVMMAFFECFIQRFMAYLQELAKLQGSDEREYTDVHGVCDIEHTQELFRSVGEEIAIRGINPDADPMEGVGLLIALIQSIVAHQSSAAVAA